MSAPIESPDTRECPECHETKPLTRGFFESYKGEGAKPTSWKPMCRSCLNAKKRERASGQKRCTGCNTCLPATLEHFPPRGVDKAHPEGGLRSRCRSCKRAAGRGMCANPTRMRNLACDPKYERGPRPCVACHDMPWRVLGPRCPCCKLVYATEPKPELVLRKFDRCG